MPVCVCVVFTEPRLAEAAASKQRPTTNSIEEERARAAADERWNLTHISVSNIWHKQTTAETEKACRQKLRKRHTHRERERENYEVHLRSYK